jgi:hypothetical protein
MTWVNELFKRLTSLDPGFSAAVRPANSAEMGRLAALLDRELPADYSDFLLAMGGYDAGLFYEERCDARIASVIEYCEEQRAFGRRLIEAACVPIAIGIDFGGYCLAVSGEPRHPPVAELNRMQPGDVVFPNLPAMTFAEAFFFELCATGHRTFVSRLPGQTRDTLSDILAGAGYLREWFSFDARLYFRAQGKRVIIVATRPERPTLEIGGQDEPSYTEALAEIRGLVGGLNYRQFVQRTLEQIREINRQVGWH